MDTARPTIQGRGQGRPGASLPTTDVRAWAAGRDAAGSEAHGRARPRATALSPVRLLDEVRRTPSLYLVLAVLLVVAAWMRLRDPACTIFLYDQARDLIVLHDLVHLDRLPLLGPEVSTGGYLGPAMYYLLAPLAALSLAPEVMVLAFAASNIAAIVIAFAICRRYFGARSGVVAATLLGFDAYAISSSRAIWNPYLLPLVSALLLLAVLRVVVETEWRWLPVVALCLALLPQLHLTAAVHVLALLPVFLAVPCLRRPPRRQLALAVACAAAMLLPLALFELRSGFANLRAIVAGVRGVAGIGVPVPANLGALFAQNVLGNPVFRSILLCGAALMVVEWLRGRLSLQERTVLAVLVLPVLVLAAVAPFSAWLAAVPRTSQSLMIVTAVACGWFTDRALGFLARKGVGGALVGGAIATLLALYCAHGVVKNESLYRDGYGVRPFGLLRNQRSVAEAVRRLAGTSWPPAGTVLTCEQGPPLQEYGRSYGYLLRLMAEPGPAPRTEGTKLYVISADLPVHDEVAGEIEGVRIFRLGDRSALARLLADHPAVTCHEVSVER